MAHIIQKVLIIAPTPFFADRGCHVHIAEQAWALQRQGQEVVIVTYGLGRDVKNLKTIRLWRFPWYRQEAIGPSWHKFYLDVLLFFTALRAARKFKPDIIHGHLHEGCLIGYLVSRLTGVGLVFDCQGSLTGELIAHRFLLIRVRWLRRMWYRLERWIDHLPQAIVAQSTEMANGLKGRFGVPEQRIFMAYDGVNTHVFRPRKQNEELKNRLGIPDNRRIIVYLGGLAKHKGVDTLLKAFVHVQREIPEVFLLLMGYPNEDHYQRRVNKLGLADSVHITGKIPYEDAPTYLALGEIAVAPKRTQTEANGKVYNYMAAGLPTIAFDTVVNRDILGDLGAYASAATDEQGLAKTMVQLLQDKPRLQKLAEAVRKKAITHYSWDNVVKRINLAYRYAYQPWQLQVFAISIRKKYKWQWAKQQIKANITPQARCLDVGSGVGTLSILQERLGGRWEFTETDSQAAKEIRQIVTGPVYEIDIFDNLLQPKKYELITVFDVLEHVSEPQKFMNRLAELLAPGGSILLTTPADNGNFYLWRRLADWLFGIDKEAHDHEVEGFSRGELRTLSEQAGMEVKRCDPFSFMFTEFIEMVYNGAYRLRNYSQQVTRGYNVSLSPASSEDVQRNVTGLSILRYIHPLLWSMSQIDRVMPIGKGYEWGLVVGTKPKNTRSAATVRR